MAVKYFLAKDIVAEITAMAFNYKAVVAERDRDAGQDRITPLAVRDWLARLRLLEGVPFNNIVADSELLPPESIRFFYLDRAWTDALVQGALSVGTVNTGDRVQLQTLYPAIRDEIDEQERARASARQRSAAAGNGRADHRAAAALARRLRLARTAGARLPRARSATTKTSFPNRSRPAQGAAARTARPGRAAGALRRRARSRAHRGAAAGRAVRRQA